MTSQVFHGHLPQRYAQSNVTALNDISTTPQRVIGPNYSRTGITFHNPGTQDVVVFPELVLVYGQAPHKSLPIPIGGDVNRQGHNERLQPTVATLGGGFKLCPAATLFFTEPTCQQAWQALALSGTNNPLTVMEQT